MKHWNILAAALVCFAFASCKQDGYKIQGDISGAMIPTKVYLKSVVSDEPKMLDSAEIKDGKFVISGSTEVPEFGILQLSNDKSFPVIIEKGNITFAVNLDDVANYKVGGTLGNDLIEDYRNEEKKFSQEFDTMSQEYRQAKLSGNMTPDSVFKAKYMALIDKRNVYIKDFIKKHSDNLAAAVLLSQEQESMPATEFTSLFADVDKNFPKSGVVQMMKQRVATQQRTVEGEPYIDFSLPNVDGKMEKFSSYVNSSKLVLLDFWAAWCGPCRRENPNVVKLYSQYKDKGLQIVGVSLDNSKEQWLSAINKDGITWPQLSDLKGWESPVAELYGVRAIPATFLIYDGKIIAKNLRGEELNNKVAELLGK